MNSKKRTGILIVVIVVVLAASVLLYNTLLKKEKMGQGAAATPQPTQVTEEATTTEAPAETQGAAEKEEALAASQGPGEDKEALEAATAAPKETAKAAQETAATADTQAPKKNTAPDFAMMTLKGEKVKLSDYMGKPIVLNFWASWCGPCRIEMPYFDTLYKEMKDEVNFVMVNLTTALSGSGETPEKAKNFVEEAGYQFPVFLDLEQEGAKTYGTVSIPQTYFINSDGEVVTYKIGAIYEEELRQNIGKIVE